MDTEATRIHHSNFNKVTITAVEAQFPTIVGCQTMTHAKDTFYVVSIGDSLHIHTPANFLYHDVLYLLACTTWTVQDQSLAGAVNTYWNNQQLPGDENKAKHIIYHNERSSVKNGCKTQFAKGVARFPANPAHKVNGPTHSMGSLKHKTEEQAHKVYSRAKKRNGPAHNTDRPANERYCYADKADDQTHRAGGSAHETDSCARKTYDSAHKTFGSAHETYGSAHKTFGSAHSSHAPADKTDPREHRTDGPEHNIDSGAYKVACMARKMDGVPVEIYSHERSEKALTRHKESSNHMDSAAPVSSTYPTLHIALIPFKGIPNRVPCAGTIEAQADERRGASATSNHCLFLSEDDESHIKFVRPDADLT